EWEHRYVGKDYVAEVGFVPRTGYLRLNPDIGYKWFPKSRVVNRHGPTMRNQIFFTEGWGLTDYIFSLEYEILLLNTANYSASYEESFIQLTEPFDPTNNDNEPLPAGSEHRFRKIGFNINSDRRPLFTYSIGANYGGFFNGKLTNLQGELAYRFQPFGSIAVTADYNRLTFDEKENNSDFLLVGPRLDITFTDKIFLTTWLQYNNQIDNINLNSRFQWRYAPASDLFIVYTDNYFANNWKVKNRAIVLKFNYWLNL
ncbi:MAG: hydrolase, partial [Cyclobacteriaceae bacterium]